MAFSHRVCLLFCGLIHSYLRSPNKVNDMDICIRQEQPADYREVEEMVREAFWNQYAPGCMEHYLLHVMRGSPAFVPELDLVAVADGRVVGLVACMKGCIVGDDGLRHEVLTLGPIAVRPACQRQGVGRRLIDRVRATAASQGYRAVLLCGDPLYYLRVGFVAAERHDIRTADNVYLAALHVCPLHEGALRGLAGRYIEDEVYSVDEAEAEAFDRQFPPKERLAGTPSQLRFAEVCAMRRDYGASSPCNLTAATAGSPASP